MTVRFYRKGKLVEVEEADPADVLQQSISDAFEAQGFIQALEAGPEDAPEPVLPSMDDSVRENLRKLDLNSVLPRTPGARSVADRLKDQWITENGELKIVARGLVLLFDPELSPDQCEALIKQFGLVRLRPLKYGRNLYETRVPEGVSAAEKSVELQENPDNRVLNADPVVLERLESRSGEPPRTAFDKQWQWPNISAPQAWQHTRGEHALVAVIDRGFLVHDLLRPNVDFTASGRFDAQGQFYNDLGGIPPYRHGTFCAAQVAASGHNGVDVCGVAPKAKLMLLSTPGAYGGWLSPLVIADAVSYAADPLTAYEDGAVPPPGLKAADVLTCAEGPKNGVGDLHLALEKAFLFADEKKLPMFWAVANENVELEKDEWVSHPSLIRVGGSTHVNTLAYPCAFGPELDFLAPGAYVHNIYPRKPASASGTSFATPIAAGIGALVLSKAPALSVSELRSLLRKSCTSISPIEEEGGRHVRVGSGILDAADAVHLARLAAGEIPGT
ncbi:MAG: S8 family serine peptidase [Pseudomonadota bacterium]